MLGLIHTEVWRIPGFRREDKALGNSPFYLMVDEGWLAEVVAYIESIASAKEQDSRL